MATIRVRKGRDGATTYSVLVRRAGFPTEAATFKQRKLAVDWAKTKEAEMIEGRHQLTAESRRRTVADAIKRYTEEELPQKRNGEMHRACLPWWDEQIGHRKLAAVTPALIKEYRSKLRREPYKRADPTAKNTSLKEGEEPTPYTRSAATANRYVACLAHVFTIARKEWQWVTNNPFANVTKLAEPKGRTRFLSVDERTRLLAQTAKDPTLHLLVVLALRTAARAGELIGLTWDNVDLDDGTLLFEVTKNGETRRALVRGEALDLLKAHEKRRDKERPEVFPGTGKGEWDYHQPFADAVAAAGITDFRFHDLRHSAATYLAGLGATESQLRAIGGWKSGVVKRYVHLAANDARGVIEALADKLDGKPAKKKRKEQRA